MVRTRVGEVGSAQGEGLP